MPKDIWRFLSGHTDPVPNSPGIGIYLFCGIKYRLFVYKVSFDWHFSFCSVLRSFTTSDRLNWTRFYNRNFSRKIMHFEWLEHFESPIRALKRIHENDTDYLACWYMINCLKYNFLQLIYQSNKIVLEQSWQLAIQEKNLDIVLFSTYTNFLKSILKSLQPNSICINRWNCHLVTEHNWCYKFLTIPIIS